MFNISGGQITRFSIPLEPALVVSTGQRTQSFTNRNGFYLTVSAKIDGATYSGIGEAVEPVFIGTSSMTSMEILECATHVITEWIHTLNVSLSVSDFAPDVTSIVDAFTHSDSLVEAIAKFTIEQAILTLIASITNIPLTEIVHSYIFKGNRASLHSGERVKINRMYNSRTSRNNIDTNLEGCVKIKVGSSDPLADAAIVNSAVSSPNLSKLRLDANQMWSLDECIAFVNALTHEAIDKIEYIEEPLLASSCDDLIEKRDILRSSVAFNKLPLMALDESLLLRGTGVIVACDESVRIVHKTSLHSLCRGRLLERFSDRVTVTCTFESGIGLAFLCAVAAAVNPSAYHGIHPLPSMVSTDEPTRKFFMLMQTCNGDIAIDVSELDIIRKTFLDLPQ